MAYIPRSKRLEATPSRSPVQIRVLTVDKKILCQIPYESFIDRATYEKAEFLGKIYVQDYNQICHGSMRTGTAYMLLLRVAGEVDNVMLIPAFSGYDTDPKTRDLKQIYIP